MAKNDFGIGLDDVDEGATIEFTSDQGTSTERFEGTVEEVDTRVTGSGLTGRSETREFELDMNTEPTPLMQEEGHTRVSEREFERSDNVNLVGVQPATQSSGILDVGFERQRPSGRFAPENVEPDPSVPADRAPDGSFVSPDREDIDEFGRDPDLGWFERF